MAEDSHDTSQQEPSQSKVVTTDIAKGNISYKIALPEIKDKRKLTVKRDRYDSRDKVVLLTGPVNLPAECFDLRPFVGPVRDQANLGSCTGHAVMGMTEILVRKYFQWIPGLQNKTAEEANGIRLSALFQYYNERVLDGDVNSDEGSSGRTMMQAIVQYGISLESDWSYNPNDFAVKPGDGAYKSALGFKPGAYHRVLDVDTAKSVIYSGYPFSISAEVYASFMSDQAARTGLIPVPSGSEEYEGGHEFFAYAYSDIMTMADGQLGGFLCRNSWGTGWGLGGDMWLPYRYVANPQLVSDMWTCHFGKPWHRSVTLEQHAALVS